MVRIGEDRRYHMLKCIFWLPSYFSLRNGPAEPSSFSPKADLLRRIWGVSKGALFLALWNLPPCGTILTTQNLVNCRDSPNGNRRVSGRFINYLLVLPLSCVLSSHCILNNFTNNSSSFMQYGPKNKLHPTLHWWPRTSMVMSIKVWYPAYTVHNIAIFHSGSCLAEVQSTLGCRQWGNRWWSVGYGHRIGPYFFFIVLT